MSGYFIRVTIYIISFMLSFWSLSSLRFQTLAKVNEPGKVQLLLILLSMALGYLVAEFVLSIVYYL